MTKTKTLAARRFELMAAEYLERMGTRIRERREELGLTQDDVARKMPGKITHNRISLWERGKNRPRDDALEALAGVLDVPVSYFMVAEPDKTQTPDLSRASVDGNAAERPQLDRIEANQEEILRLLRLVVVTEPSGVEPLRREELGLPPEPAERAPDRRRRAS